MHAKSCIDSSCYWEEFSYVRQDANMCTTISTKTDLSLSTQTFINWIIYKCYTLCINLSIN